ncbi:MAG TPA: tetratricopeptide repeat protein [Saprospiraceae bacterium]|nr:tetratricopeptide repeat protein [Saprospiraceae bacterium]
MNKHCAQLIYACLLLFTPLFIKSQSTAIIEKYLYLADSFIKNRQPDSAIFYLQKAAPILKKEGPAESFVNTSNQLGILLTRQDKYEEALAVLNEALDAGLSQQDIPPLSVATTHISLGVVYNAQQKYNEALNHHHKALDIRIKLLGQTHADVATSYGNLGNVYRNNQQFQESIEAHTSAMKIRETIFGLQSPEIVESYVGLARVHKDLQDYPTALGYFEKALKNKIIQKGEAHADLAKFYQYLSDIWYLMEDKVKGEEYKNTATKLTNGSRS